MGFRFRKSVKICKGVRVNFNKNSVGLSISGRGYGYTVNSKGRRTAHVGIPETGLSYSETFSKKRNNNYSNKKTTTQTTVRTTINLKMDDNGKMTFYDSKGNEIVDASLINKIKRTPQYKLEKERMQKEHDNETLKEIEQYNKQNEEMLNINRLSANSIYSERDFENELQKLEKKTYKKKVFDKEKPTEYIIKNELMQEAKKEIKSIAFWKLKSKWNNYISDNLASKLSERLNIWNKEKEDFDKNEIDIEKKKNIEYEEEYANNKLYLNNILNGNKECINNDIDIWLESLETPLEFNISYDYVESEKTLWIDLDLPEIEDFPNQKAVQMANGNKKMKHKTKQELNSDYKKYVFGLAIFICSHLFNISPKIYNIVISGYTQRRMSSGDIKDEYIYSIIFDRENIKNYNLIEEDSFEISMKFKNRCNITSTNILKEIKPFER